MHDQLHTCLYADACAPAASNKQRLTLLNFSACRTAIVWLKRNFKPARRPWQSFTDGKLAGSLILAENFCGLFAFLFLSCRPPPFAPGIASRIVPGTGRNGFLGSAVLGMIGAWLGTSWLGNIGPSLEGVPLLPAIIGSSVVMLVFYFASRLLARFSPSKAKKAFIVLILKTISAGLFSNTACGAENDSDILSCADKFVNWASSEHPSSHFVIGQTIKYKPSGLVFFNQTLCSQNSQMLRNGRMTDF